MIHQDLDYTEECETSKSFEQRSDKGKNSKPTCHFCNKKGHTMNVCRSRKINQQNTPKIKGYCHKYNMQGHLTQDFKTKVLGHQDLMVTTTIAKSMDIELLSADQSQCGHLISKQGETTMHTTIIGTTIQSKVVTSVKNMVMYLRIS